MKNLLLLGILFVSFLPTAFAQQITIWIPMSQNGFVSWITLDTSKFTIQNGKLTVIVPPPVPVPTLKRVYDQTLVFDPVNKNWPLPAGAVDIVVYVNGLRYHNKVGSLAGDFNIGNGAVVPNCVTINGNPVTGPLCEWDSGFLVTVDYSIGQ